jgi:hypothetical protein
MIRTTPGAPELPLSVLRAAYVDGWFPMGERGTRLIEWFSPDPRGVLPLTAFHVSARLGRTVRSGRFEIRVDTAFAAVMDHCAERDHCVVAATLRQLARRERELERARHPRDVHRVVFRTALAELVAAAAQQRRRDRVVEAADHDREAEAGCVSAAGIGTHGGFAPSSESGR